ncbi:MAG: transcriptional regulator, partial [Bacteroidota bacterium]
EYASGLQNLGILYRNIEMNDSALLLYRQAYTIFLGLNDSVSIVRVRYNIGVILKNQKKFREAEEEMQSILQFCQQKNITEGQIYSLSALASIFDQTNRTAEGLVAIDSAISKAQRYRLSANLSLLLDRQHEILARLGRFNEAYQAALRSRDLSDSLLSVEKQKEISSLKTRFETERKEAENVLLKKDIEVQKSHLWLLRIGGTLGSTVFVVLIFMLILRYKQVKEQKQHAEEKSIRLEHEKRNKEQELVFQSLVQTELIQINRSVKETLFPFKLKFPRKNQQDEFEQVLNGLTRDAGKDPLAEFELLFTQLHASFYENILRICPDLTKTELHVCAMIRLNLSTKDIARLTNININSIEMTRYHIRKKLNMEQGENLAALLMTV